MNDAPNINIYIYIYVYIYSNSEYFTAWRQPAIWDGQKWSNMKNTLQGTGRPIGQDMALAVLELSTTQQCDQLRKRSLRCFWWSRDIREESGNGRCNSCWHDTGFGPFFPIVRLWCSLCSVCVLYTKRASPFFLLFLFSAIVFYIFAVFCCSHFSIQILASFHSA